MPSLLLSTRRPESESESDGSPSSSEPDGSGITRSSRWCRSSSSQKMIGRLINAVLGSEEEQAEPGNLSHVYTVHREVPCRN